MFQTMKRERTIHLGIKSEEDVCTSSEIIFEIFEILYLYEILHLNIWILKVKRMSAHRERDAYPAIFSACASAAQ